MLASLYRDEIYHLSGGTRGSSSLDAPVQRCQPHCCADLLEPSVPVIGWLLLHTDHTHALDPMTACDKTRKRCRGTWSRTMMSLVAHSTDLCGSGHANVPQHPRDPSFDKPGTASQPIHTMSDQARARQLVTKHVRAAAWL